MRLCSHKLSPYSDVLICSIRILYILGNSIDSHLVSLNIFPFWLKDVGEFGYILMHLKLNLHKTVSSRDSVYFF